MGLSRERRGDDSLPTAIRLSPVPHHAIFDGFGAGVAKGDSEPIHRSLENGGSRDPCFATPRDVKAHIAWCGSLLYHTMRFWGVFRLVWHTGWERISRTDGQGLSAGCSIELRTTPSHATHASPPPAGAIMSGAPLFASRLAPPAGREAIPVAEIRRAVTEPRRCCPAPA